MISEGDVGNLVLVGLLDDLFGAVASVGVVGVSMKCCLVHGNILTYFADDCVCGGGFCDRVIVWEFTRGEWL